MQPFNDLTRDTLFMLHCLAKRLFPRTFTALHHTRHSENNLAEKCLNQEINTQDGLLGLKRSPQVFSFGITTSFDEV